MAKALIKLWTRIPCCEQRLIFNTVKLANSSCTLNLYGNKNLDEITLLLRIQGCGNRAASGKEGATEKHIKPIKLVECRVLAETAMEKMEVTDARAKHVIVKAKSFLNDGPQTSKDL